MTNKNLDKIGKMLSDAGKSKLKEFDIVFVIDATGSMDSYIEAAKCTAEDISRTLRLKFPDTHFQYGYVFYRDPIDSHEDFHEIINLTDNVNSLPKQIGKIRAQGGGDMPEDWVGAYKKVNEEIKWRNGTKVIFHLADAGAHGKLFTPFDKYPDEEQKLINEVNICCEQKVKIFGFVINEEARNSFEKCKEIYIKKGEIYEIYNLSPSSHGGIYNYIPPRKFDESKSLFGDFKYNIFKNKEDDINKHTNLFENNNIFGVKEIDNKNNNNNDTTSIYVNDKNGDKSNSLFGTNKNNNTTSLFGTDKKNRKSNSLFGDNTNNNTTSLFGTDKNNNNTSSLFANNKNNSKSNSLFRDDKDNINTTNLFGINNNNSTNKFTNIISDNKRNIIEKNEKINNQSKSLFLNNKDNNNLFDFRKNKTENKLFGNIIENNNNNVHSLFGNVKENNNNTSTLFGNTWENNNDKSSQDLFGNLKENQDKEKNEEKNSYKDMGYQSRLNSSFFNLVVNSIQNVNKSEINIFKNINNSNE